MKFLSSFTPFQKMFFGFGAINLAFGVASGIYNIVNAVNAKNNAEIKLQEAENMYMNKVPTNTFSRSTIKYF